MTWRELSSRPCRAAAGVPGHIAGDAFGRNSPDPEKASHRGGGGGGGRAWDMLLATS